MLIPRLALSPVSAPTKAMVAVFPPLELLPVELELFLLLPHAAAIKPAAATPPTIRTEPRSVARTAAKRWEHQGRGDVVLPRKVDGRGTLTPGGAHAAGRHGPRAP